MMRLFHFSTGTLFTYAFCLSLTLSGLTSLILSQLVSLLGGVLSTVIVAWLQHHWHRDKDDPPPDDRTATR